MATAKQLLCDLAALQAASARVRAQSVNVTALWQEAAAQAQAAAQAAQQASQNATNAFIQQAKGAAGTALRRLAHGTRCL